MGEGIFSEFIEAMDQPLVPFPGVKARLMQGVSHQAVFFELPAGLVIPPHSHCAQWGVVVKGKMEMTIGGEKRALGPGDTYKVGVGEVHEVVVIEESAAIDFFDDPARYRIA